MNVVLHSSDLFVPILSVSVVSILENNKNLDEIIIYVIENKITDEHKQMLSRMLRNYDNAKIIFIPMPDINKDFSLELKMIKNIWLLDSYCRLFLGTILPNNVDRVLYLDSDTICNGSLDELYNTELDDYYCAGVADCLGERYYKLFNMDRSTTYCNSGMILFNLKSWREDKLENIIVQYVRKNNGYVFFMEQSVMNIVLQNRIKIIHPKYNTYTLMVAFTYENLYLLRWSIRFYSKAEIMDAIANPVIIHLTNSFYIKGRAWMKKNQHPYNGLFLKYRDMTPWKNEELFSTKISVCRSFIYKLMDIVPQKIVAVTVGLIYNIIRPIRISNAQKKYWNQIN